VERSVQIPARLSASARPGAFVALFVLAASLLVATCSPAVAYVRVQLEATRGIPPSLFSNGMVLQRDTPAPIWGTADPGETVRVELAGETRSIVTGDDGRWRIELGPLAAGGPYTMWIRGDANTLEIRGVLVGDVWVCAGQSNLAIRRAHKNDLAEYPQIHTIGRGGTWTDRPSGMAFAFARELHLDAGVPIGLINRAAPGTAMRSWLSPSAANDTDPDVRTIVGDWEDWGEQYEMQVRPFAGYAIKGVLYWQGEQDLKLARQHPGHIDSFYHLLPALIRSWRADWQRGNLPFVLVQLPTGGGLQSGEAAAPLPELPPQEDIAVRMRQATFNGLSEPETALTVSVDIEGAIHPKDRALYGYRLASVARGSAYGQSFDFSGPIYSSMSVEEGGRVRLRFKPNTAEGLHAMGGPLAGFSISGDGTTFVWAEAEIQGNEVVVWNDAIAGPGVVRYAWGHRPTWANLFNGADLGAAPFSTTETPAP
jgi:sialate O-acetylesterase